MKPGDLVKVNRTSVSGVDGTGKDIEASKHDVLVFLSHTYNKQEDIHVYTFLYNGFLFYKMSGYPPGTFQRMFNIIE